MLTNVKGGRNTGVRAAQGRYIVYIDCDDYFVSGALPKLADELRKDDGLDILMYDYCEVDGCNGNVRKACFYSHLPIRKMSGSEFMQTQPVPWGPCLYAYRRLFLVEKNITFTEGVRFEDADYALRCTVEAATMRFVPLVVFNRTIYAEQTTKVSNDTNKVIDLFKLAERTRQLATDTVKSDPTCGEAVMGHYRFMFHTNVTRYLWHLPAGDIVKMLRNYRPTLPQPDRTMRFCAKHPVLVASALIAAKPLLAVAHKIYSLRKK